MIKQATTLLLFFGLFCATSMAQTTPGSTSTPSSTANQALMGKNLIKLNLSGLAFQNYIAQYERVLNQKQSVALTIGIAPNVPIPFKSTLLSDFGQNSDARRAIQTTVYSKTTVTLEYRFYFSGKAPKGFYFAPFLRYMNMSQSQDYTFTPSDGKLHTAHMSSNFSGFGAGFLLGSQFPIGKHFAIDWWIIGPFYGTKINATFVGTDPQMGDMSAQDLANVKSDIENIKLPLYKTSAVLTPGPNTIQANITGPYYGIRAMGICLVYRF